jgi:hypothetical protein
LTRLRRAGRIKHQDAADVLGRMSRDSLVDTTSAEWERWGMVKTILSSGLSRRSVLSALASFPILSTPLFRTSGWAQLADPLASWNFGLEKQSITVFVQATTDASSKNFVPQEARIATFDQDGTLWVEHPCTLRSCMP